jgi:hypothetical protein
VIKIWFLNGHIETRRKKKEKKKKRERIENALYFLIFCFSHVKFGERERNLMSTVHAHQIFEKFGEYDTEHFG